MAQPLPEYRNLTKSELVWADHAFEIGDYESLRKFRELSASRTHRPDEEEEGVNEMHK